MRPTSFDGMLQRLDAATTGSPDSEARATRQVIALIRRGDSDAAPPALRALMPCADPSEPEHVTDELRLAVLMANRALWPWHWTDTVVRRAAHVTRAIAEAHALNDAEGSVA